MLTKKKIAIVGGGVAGSSTAFYLGQLGMNVTLFEKESSISSGPPYCHLHAGGNLYREISDKQCVTLLKQSIEFVRAYPFSIDYRPTVIAIPKTDKSNPEALLPRLTLLKREYEAIISKDRQNEVLGKSKEYYKLYHKKEIEALKNGPIQQQPKSLDEWMVPALQQLELSKIQFPIIMVQEYGINLFRFASGLELAIDKMANVSFKPNTTVTNIEKKEDTWSIAYEHEQKQEASFDYLINATGYKTGSIDDMLGINSEKMVEFKASYVSHWKANENTLFPEIIIHGERGTPRGMGQLTPYPNGYFQLHGMTEEITLYKGGLVSSTNESAQAKLDSHFISKLDHQWEKAEVEERTKKAIAHLADYIPSFKEATVGAKPLFGAQQIPGDDPTLRVAEVSFPTKDYARCEIVKVSSSLDMVDTIIKNLIELGHMDVALPKRVHLNYLDESSIAQHAQELAESRDYPRVLANRNVEKAI